MPQKSTTFKSSDPKGPNKALCKNCGRWEPTHHPDTWKCQPKIRRPKVKVRPVIYD
jgi:hypothetical protein